MCLPSPCGILPRACSEALRCKKRRVPDNRYPSLRYTDGYAPQYIVCIKRSSASFCGAVRSAQASKRRADRLSARDAPAHLQKTARASDRRRRRSFPATKKTASCPFYTTRKWSTAAAPSARQADIRSSRVPRGFDESSREYLSHNHHLRYFVSYTLKNRCMLIALSHDLLRQYLPRAEQRRCGRERVVRDGADAGADV